MANEIVKRTIHVHFSDAQKAAMADQMADIQAQIESTTEQKKQALGDANAKLTTLRAQASKYAHAVREGEGDIEVDCMWRLDPHKPFRHLWNLDTMEIIATEGFQDPKKKKDDKQLDLTAATPAPPPTGNAPAAGSEPGAQIIKVNFAPRPPCPAPVEKNPGGICGQDGDVDHHEGFCAAHFASLDGETRGMIVDALRERRRSQRVQAAADRQKKQVEDAIATPEEEKRAKERQGQLAELRANHKAAVGIHGAAEPLDGKQRCTNCNGVLSTDGAMFVATMSLVQVAEDGSMTILADGKFTCSRPSDTELLAATVAALPPEERAQALAAAGLAEDAPATAPAEEAAAAGGAAAPVGPEPQAPEVSEYTEFNAVKWPLCPGCGEDGLWSVSNPPDVKTIVRCSECRWRPKADPIPTRHLAPVPAERTAVEGNATTIKIGEREINVTGIADPSRLIKTGPCPHAAAGDACYTCTAAAAEGERVRMAEGALGAEPEDAAPPAAGECAKVRRTLTAHESKTKEAVCHACNKILKVRPVVEAGTYVATLAKHKRQ